LSNNASHPASPTDEPLQRPVNAARFDRERSANPRSVIIGVEFTLRCKHAPRKSAG